MKITKYPDGASYINGIGMGLHSSVFRINSYEDLWHLNQAVDAYFNYFNTKPTITIPNLIDAQADIRFNEDESSGLKLVCQFLNGMNANFKIFHPHNAEVVEALIDDVQIIDNSKFVQRLLYRGDINSVCNDLECADLELQKRLILMSADAGGYKPLIKLANQIKWEGEIFSASKARQDGKMYQYIDPLKDFGGKDILIIDDISVYGGTFKGLAKILRKRNCGKLYLAVSHMTVQDLGKYPVTNYFDRVFTTNSKYDEYYADNLVPSISPNERIPQNLEIIKLFNN